MRDPTVAVSLDYFKKPTIDKLIKYFLNLSNRHNRETKYVKDFLDETFLMFMGKCDPGRRYNGLL